MRTKIRANEVEAILLMLALLCIINAAVVVVMLEKLGQLRHEIFELQQQIIINGHMNTREPK